MSVKTTDPLTIGLDIGIASVGWAVLAPTRIVTLGVRCFDKAETAKEGESLNLARRTARLMRRRLRRRAWRLTKLARLLKREGLISDVNTLKQQPSKGFKTPNLWKLRAEALDRKLDGGEWARVIYHVVKHRGFHWISKAEEAKADDDKKEGGKVKQGLAGTKKLMQDKNYQTAAEMVIGEFFSVVKDANGEAILDKNKQPILQGRARNTTDDYSKSLSRVLLSEELAKLFAAQREKGNAHAGTELEKRILGNGNRKSGLFWEQKPALQGEALLKMLGRCTFERKGGHDKKGEYRAPKASFTAERHVWLTRLNNLRIVIDGKQRPLNEEERKIALPLPYRKKGDKGFTYEQLRNALEEAGLSEKFRFTGLSYPSATQQEGKAKDPEEEKLVKFSGWHEIRKALEKANLGEAWLKLSTMALEGKPELFDQIAWVLSVYKEDEEVTRELNRLDLPNKDKLIATLLTVRFDKFSNLSLKALCNILPHMEAGLRYDEACEKAGYHHSQLHEIGTGEHKYLPPFYSGRDKDGRLKFNEEMDIPRNPVVLRSLNQARKVINALIKTYGTPHEVHIELARELSKNFDERKDIKKAQDEYRNRNESVRKKFSETFRFEPKGREFEKYQLYEEQGCKCAYCLEALNLDDVIKNIGYSEVDHALPYSRSYDDSKNNKVLVHTKCNREKGNRTPYEYLTLFAGGENGERWHKFKVWVEGNKSYRQAKRNRLLKKDFGEEESKSFSERNLNDTRYICRFFKNYVERYLKLHEDSEAKRCVVVNGQLTSFLRARWGLVKVRSNSDRHHALDAAVVAACSHSMVKGLSDYSRRKELENVKSGYTDPTGVIFDIVALRRLEEHFPKPWEHFREELLLRLNQDDPKLLKAEAAHFGYPQDALENTRPLFISRAPQRRNSGALHKETIYGINQSEFNTQATAINRKAVADLKENDLDKIVGAHEPRNAGLIKSLRQWLHSQKMLGELVSNLGKGKNKKEPTQKEKQHMDELRQLPRKPLKSDPENGPFMGPIIKKVKLIETKKSGAYVRNGVAESGQVVRTRLYRHGDEFLFLPRYELPDEKLLGLTPIPADAVDTGVDIYSNDVVEIGCPNLSHCYKAIRTYKDDETGEQLIDVVAAFPSGAFLGYWAYFEPSNDRPVVQLHDSAQFFLLEAGKETKRDRFMLIAKKKKGGKKGESGDVYEYLEKSPPMDRKPLKFSLEENIKRKIGSAKSFKKFHVDVLGNIYPAPPEKRCDLA